jgi:cytochrome c2
MRLSIVATFFICVFLGCETANYAPVVRSTSSTAAQLERGRSLFVHRCIECHTLPPIWKYSRDDWPKIVNDMSHRASLKPQDRDAVVAYILAVRAAAR